MAVKSPTLDLLRHNVLIRLEQQNLRKSELARRMGVPPSSVYMWLGEGKTVKNPSIPVLEKMAKALELPLWELLRPAAKAERWSAREPGLHPPTLPVEDPDLERLIRLWNTLPRDRRRWLLELIEDQANRSRKE